MAGEFEEQIENDGFVNLIFYRIYILAKKIHLT